MSRLLHSAAAAVLAFTLAAPLSAGEPNFRSAPAPREMPVMAIPASATHITPVRERAVLAVGKAIVVELPHDAGDVVVGNAAVADAIVRTPRRVFLLGVEVGQTNVVFLDPEGREFLNVDIRVERDVVDVQDMVNRLVPDARVTVEALNDNLIVTGTVGSVGDADRVIQIARRFVDDPEKVLSNIGIRGADQVLLKVRIVEVQRTIIKQLGVNLSGGVAFTDSFGANLGSSNSFALNGPQALGGLTLGLNDSDPGGDLTNIGGVLQAFERVGLVRTLAEPNLTAISGEGAQFLAGGEFPVPVGQDQEGNIVVEYKPFGVGLNFTPVVLGDGRISLFISTEVSELSNQDQLSLGGGGDSNQFALTLPSLTVRRAQTTVELASGGSLVIAGLIQQVSSQALDGTPGARELPGLGALFRARDSETEETELIVVVTPYLVEGVARDQLVSPDDGFADPSTFESTFFGRINHVYAEPGARAPGPGWHGPAGFIIDEKG